MKQHSYLSHIHKTVIRSGIAILSAVMLFTASVIIPAVPVQASSVAFVILNRYNCTMKIGQTTYLVGIASNGKRISWKSSSSRIASVNTYGQITAKKAGTCKITGKVTGGEASCQITVQKTSIHLSAATITMENGSSAVLRGSTSNGSTITWKSQKSSIASIDESGTITACKPGETTVTATADGTKKSCRITVKKPKITLNRTSASLYRGQSLSLTAKVSSGRKVSWKSRKSSVATVSASGKVTAKKHGTTQIRATVDGVTKECELTVKPPVIQLNKTSASIKKGQKLTLKASVSSGNIPTWKSSKSSVATVDQNGVVTAKNKGSCTISVSEDGTTEKCYIQVKA